MNFRPLQPVFLGTLLLLSTGGCRSRERTGQIFLVTEARDNVKMGMVDVHVIKPDQLKPIAVEIASLHEAATERFLRHSAQCRKDCERLDQFYLELQNLIPPGLPVESITAFRAETLQRVHNLQASDRPELVDPLLGEDALLVKLKLALPASVTKTDADGRFTVRAATGDWLIAQAHHGSLETWISRVPADGAPILMSNDAWIHSSDALAVQLKQAIGHRSALRTAEAMPVSPDTEAWVKQAKESAVAARQKAIADNLATAKDWYWSYFRPGTPALLEKWVRESWLKLQDEVESIDRVEDGLEAAERYNSSRKTLRDLVFTATEQQAQYEEKKSEQLRQHQIAEQRWIAESLALQAAAKKEEQLQRAAEKDAAEKQAELERLRNTPVFQGEVSIVTSGFRSFEHGFGFIAESTFGGTKLRIFLNGRTPGALYGGDKPDAEFNLDNRLNGSETFTSGDHQFRIDWDRPGRLSWHPKIAVFRLN